MSDEERGARVLVEKKSAVNLVEAFAYVAPLPFQIST